MIFDVRRALLIGLPALLWWGDHIYMFRSIVLLTRSAIQNLNRSN